MTSYFKILFFSMLVGIPCCQGEKYTAEGYFVVESKVIHVYEKEIQGPRSDVAKRQRAEQNIRRDIDYILTEINKLYSSLSRHGLDIEIKVRDITILDEDVFSHTLIQQGLFVDTNRGLAAFDQWLISQQARSQLHYDFAILWTGYDLSGGSSGEFTTGYAHVGQICDSSRATGVVEFNATYHTAVVTAHEVAHILGANHDGPASQHIMASSCTPRMKRRWSFSGCTASMILENIEDLSANCLLETDHHSMLPSTTWSSYRGGLFDPDVICQRAVNSSDSYMCKSYRLYNNSAPKGSNVCGRIYCHVPGTSFYCTAAFPSEGMICDKEKRCDDGVCKPDTSTHSANVDPNCVLGDQAQIEFSNIEFKGTCVDYITQYGNMSCYNPVVEQLCCGTCKERSTGVPDCEYGDKSKQCTKYPKNAVCPTYGETMCCSYCNGYVDKRDVKMFDVINIVQDNVTTALVQDASYALPFGKEKTVVDEE